MSTFVREFDGIPYTINHTPGSNELTLTREGKDYLLTRDPETDQYTLTVDGVTIDLEIVNTETGEVF